MMYYRNPRGTGPTLWNPARMRFLTTAPLVLYPFGCLALLILGTERPGPHLLDIIGFVPIILALACFIFLMPSYLQRVAGEEVSQLDEFELDMRRRAHTFAHHIFGGLTLLGLFYMFVVSDAERLSGLWRPTTGEHWNAIFGGALLAVLTLPSAYLAWKMPPPAAEEPA